MTEALEPCPNPWCEGRGRFFIGRNNLTGKWHVGCDDDDCMIAGPWADTKAEAVTLWNAPERAQLRQLGEQ